MASLNLNPALAAFAAELGAGLVLAQVSIRRMGEGFELRHVEDKDLAEDSLRFVKTNEIRGLTQLTEKGSFRPLKSAPNLKRGWRVETANVAVLGEALNHFYPGAVADWFAVRQSAPPLTSYRDFTQRQSGMYRITTHLDDRTAAAMTRACCHPESCLKRRLWTLRANSQDEILQADSAGEKSIIPCLEPCAILLEFARKVARWEKDGGPAANEAPGETSSAECDFDAPDNPRRRRFLLEKPRGGVTSSPHD